MGVKPIISTDAIGVSAKKGGLGVSVSVSSDGVRVGGGIGILDVEYNLNDGTGKVGWGFGLYEMEVSRDGCNWVKDFYINGIYTHTEYQRDPDCDEEFPERDEPNETIDYEDEEKIQEEIERRPYPLDPSRFPLNKVVLVSMKWRAATYIRAPKDRWTKEKTFGLGRLTIKSASISSLYEPDKWTDRLFKIVRVGNSADYKLDSWQFVTDYFFLETEHYTPFREGFSRNNILNSDENDITGLGQRRFNIPFGTNNGDGGSQVFEFFLGTYGFFLDWIAGKHWDDYLNGHQTIPISDMDLHPFTKIAKERILLNAEFYDENGLIPPRKLSPPPPRPMPKDCCKKLEKKIDRIEKVLNTKQLIDRKGVKVPRKLTSPGAKGTDRISNYADYFAEIIRIHAISGVFPFAIEVNDTNLAQRGQQKMTAYYPTATDAIKAIAENTAKQGAEIDALLNIGVRLGIASVEQRSDISWLKKTVDSIVAFFGFPTREKIIRVRTEFDPSLGARKKVAFRGFGPAPAGTNEKFKKELKKILKPLEEGEPEALKKILELFLNSDDTPVRYEEFVDEEGAPTLTELLERNGFR